MADVNLTISQDIVNPIVQAKIKEAVIESLGGVDILIGKVVDNIIKQRVDKDGKVNSYSSENKFSWMDVVLTQQIEKAAKESIIEVISEQTQNIKDELIRQLKTKKGSNIVASALIDSMNGTFVNNWSSKLSIEFKKLDRY
jgi:hypothetical protein